MDFFNSKMIDQCFGRGKEKWMTKARELMMWKGGGRGEGGPKEKENEKLICVKKI